MGAAMAHCTLSLCPAADIHQWLWCKSQCPEHLYAGQSQETGSFLVDSVCVCVVCVWLCPCVCVCVWYVLCVCACVVCACVVCVVCVCCVCVRVLCVLCVCVRVLCVHVLCVLCVYACDCSTPLSINYKVMWNTEPNMLLPPSDIIVYDDSSNLCWQKTPHSMHALDAYVCTLKSPMMWLVLRWYKGVCQTHPQTIVTDSMTFTIQHKSRSYWLHYWSMPTALEELTIIIYVYV